jgi:formylglycine-generating enzyme required for sulfatase activity
VAVLFVSHSSKDDPAANTLEAWLHANGFTDVFVDHSRIAGGDSWRRALQAAVGACRVVLCLVTEGWLASRQCLAEFDASFYMGKRVIPLFLISAPSTLDEQLRRRLAQVSEHYQGLDLIGCVKGGALDIDADGIVADRLKAGLREAGALGDVGLDPEAFAIDRTLRPTPFPGLASFGDDDADAALFYGRSREIERTLEEIRAMRAKLDQRPFVILGASGAGKSSLLKAGIIPRLRRESPAWLPLRAFRPGTDPLLNFSEALARTFADFGKQEAQGDIRDRLLRVWSDAERRDGALTPSGSAELETTLGEMGRALRSAAGRDAASLLISVDQAEEIVRTDNHSGEALSDYFRASLSANSGSWQIILAIRTDSFQELQGHRRLRGLDAHPFDLRALPVFRFDSVIEEPAKRYGVKVAPALVDALMEAAPKEDALPLLAFALQRLWRDYAASRALTKDNYDKVGGLPGLIEHACERALRGLTPETDSAPSSAPTKRQVDLAASTFVPTLAQINDSGAVTRRIAPWGGFDGDQQALLFCFEQWRLIVRKGEEENATVEVAHEALFREWSRFAVWLEPERARLETLRSLQDDSLAWDRNQRDPAYLNHRDKRLAAAEALVGIGAYHTRLSAADLDYLKDCRAAEDAARRRTRRTRIALMAMPVVVIAALVGWLNDTFLRETWNWYWVMKPYMLANVQPYILSPEAEKNLKPLSAFRECAHDCPEMVVIPPGEFMMGAPPSDPDQYPNESPQHQVRILRRFAIGKYHVTVTEWNSCVLVGGCPRIRDGEHFGVEKRPMVNVSWRDAQKYAAWLSTMTGKTYRLITEAEWEYAARAGTTTRYYWGDFIEQGHANCVGCGSEWDNRETSPVGSFKPNGFGLYDMAGNVWQWNEDCVRGDGDGDYSKASPDGAAWSPEGCTRYYSRGGSFIRPPRNLRVTSRYPSSSDQHSIYHGFRIARTLTP